MMSKAPDPTPPEMQSLPGAVRESTPAGTNSAPVAGDLASYAWRHARRIVIFVVGFTVILIGLALILVPGPLTIPPIIAGLAILSLEFVWARRLLRRVKRGVQAAAAYCKGSSAEQTPPRAGAKAPSGDPL